MSLCPKCREQTLADDNFCGMCGHALNSFGDGAGMTQQDLKAIDIRFSLGIVYFKMNKFDQAREIFDEVLAREPGHAQALAYLERIAEAVSAPAKTN